MIPRSFLQERLRCCVQPSSLVFLAFAAVPLSLQGCGSGAHTFGKRSRSAKPDAPVVKTEDDSDHPFADSDHPFAKVPHMPVILEANKVHRCDPIVQGKSEEFRNAVQQDAQAYYDGVVKTFSLDFVRFPFCLENSYFVVHALERKLRGIDEYKRMSPPRFEEALNNTITSQFSQNEDKWQSMCQDWSERSKAHQLSNLPMVRKVLGFSGKDDELKAQINAYFHWEPWWAFFRDVSKAGCVRRYTQRCIRSAKVADRHAKELVTQTMGDRDLTWHAFDVPSEGLLQVSEDWRHQVPIELKATGQQLRSRHA